MAQLNSTQINNHKEVMYTHNKNTADFTIENNVLKGKVLPFPRDYTNLGKFILDRLSKNQNSVGQIDVFTEREDTYGEMKDRSIRCALWMRKQGILPGDVITMISPSHMDSIIPYLATTFIGAIFSPLGHVMKEYTLKTILSQTKPKIIFVTEEFVNMVVNVAKSENLNVKVIVFEKINGFESFSEIIEQQNEKDITCFRCTEITGPEHPVLILYTSGTTGLPKGATLCHGNIITAVRHVGELSLDCSVLLMIVSFSWITSVFFSTAAVCYNTKAIVCSELEEELACKLIEKYKIQWLLTPANILIRLMNYSNLENYDLSSIKVINSAGTIIRPNVIETIKKLLPHVHLTQIYGSTEIGGATSNELHANYKQGSCGKIGINVELKVLDTQTGEILGPNQMGELCFKTGLMMLGYYGNPEATREAIDEDGFMHTGDMGYYDEEGDVFYVDRIKMLIKYRNYQVSPLEIENVLMSYPGVQDAVVVSVPHHMDDEHALAFVTKVPGAKITEQELIDLVASELEDYKHLRGGVKFLDKIPCNLIGKVMRAELVDMARKLLKENADLCDQSER